MQTRLCWINSAFEFPVRHHPAHEEMSRRGSNSSTDSRVISQDHTWFGAVARFAAAGTYTSCVRCTGRPLRRAAWRDRSGSGAGVLTGTTERAAHAGFTPTFPEFGRRTFPCTSNLFSSRAFRRSRRTFSSSGFRSGLRPRFFDRAFSRRAGATSTGPLAAGVDPPRRAQTIRSLYALKAIWVAVHYHSLPFSLAAANSLRAPCKRAAIGDPVNDNGSSGTCQRQWDSTGLIREQCPVW